MNIRAIELKDIKEVTAIWNESVDAADCFMDEKIISEKELWDLFNEQTETIIIEIEEKIVGFHFIHPNLIGRCSHIANAAYAVSRDMRGKGIGQALVLDSIKRSKKHGFLGMQFNAVVNTNTPAIKLYLKHGFRVIGTVPNGFRIKDNTYKDMLIFLKYWG